MGCTLFRCIILFIITKVWDLNPDTSEPKNTIQTIASIGRMQWRPSHPAHIASAATVVDFKIHVWYVVSPFGNCWHLMAFLLLGTATGPICQRSPYWDTGKLWQVSSGITTFRTRLFPVLKMGPYFSII